MAKRYATSTEIRAVVDAAINTGAWHLCGCSKHRKLQHIESKRVVVFAVSPSDRRAALNLRRDIRHIERGLPGWGIPPTA